MSDIILLSIDADESRASPLLDALVNEKLDVWWEQIALDEGKFSSARLRKFREARCVILVWSDLSSSAEAVQFLRIAKITLEAGNAICVYVDDAELPESVLGSSLYDLRAWRSDPANWRKWFGGNLFRREVVAAAKFKVAGKDPPPSDAARRMFVRQAITVLPAIGALFYFVTTVIGLWVDLDQAQGASDEEEAAWVALEKSSCDDLRGFLGSYPDGYYADQTQARLDARSTTIERQWESIERTLELYVSSGTADPRASEQAATAFAQERGTSEAERSCIALAEAGQARMIESQAQPRGSNCERSSDGFRCSYDGQAICSLEEPRDVEVEVCDAP